MLGERDAELESAIGSDFATASPLRADLYIGLAMGLLGIAPQNQGTGLQLVANGLAALGLILGIVFGASLLYQSRLSTLKAERSINAAKGAFFDVTEQKFADWDLTVSEREIAWLSLKGFSQQEMADLRGSSAGTIKSQTNAIYRKSGTKSRGQLISLLVDDLLDSDGIVGAPRSE